MSDKYLFECKFPSEPKTILGTHRYEQINPEAAYALFIFAKLL